MDAQLNPAAGNRAITSDQQEPSVNSPCTSTTLRASSGVAFAAMPRAESSEDAAPVSRAVEKVRLFISARTPSASSINSVPFRRYHMRHLGRPLEMEPLHVLLHHAVCIGHALVLT